MVTALTVTRCIQPPALKVEEQPLWRLVLPQAIQASFRWLWEVRPESFQRRVLHRTKRSPHDPICVPRQTPSLALFLQGPKLAREHVWLAKNRNPMASVFESVCGLREHRDGIGCMKSRKAYVGLMKNNLPWNDGSQEGLGVPTTDSNCSSAR